MTPLIGLPGRHASSTNAVRGEAVAAGSRYARAVNENGGSVVIIPPYESGTQHLRDTISRMDGVLLHGGIDIAPARYGQAIHPEVRHVDESLDEFEMHFLAIALEMNKPVLAICRGMQVLNVLTGGSLIQHIPEQFPSPVNHWSAHHAVFLEPDSRIASAIGATRIEEVSSFHHQAVGDLGANLRPVAHSVDGLIEAIEHDDARWVIGVQWHPEDLLGSVVTRELFLKYVEICCQDDNRKFR